MAPLVSVIIPTYNRAALVAEALASVKAQTYRDYEIVVVDDGGTDGTWEVLSGCREIRVLRHPHRRGVSAARNTGINAARGQWLAFLDSDDLWLPDKLARQMAYLTTRPSLCLGQTDETWVRRGVRVNKPLSHRKVAGWIFLPSLSRCMVSPSAAMVHRRLFQDHGAFDETLPAAEDYDLWLRLTWRYEVGLVDEPLVIKRGGHPDQLSGQWGLDRFRIRALVKLLAEPDLPEALRPGGPPHAGRQGRHLRPGVRQARPTNRSGLVSRLKPPGPGALPRPRRGRGPENFFRIWWHRRRACA